MADVEDDKNKAKNPQKKNKRLKRKKMCQNHLSKSRKRSLFRGQKVDNNEKASNNKNAGDDKDASPPTSIVATSSGLFAPVTISIGLPAPIAAFLSLPTPVAAFFGLSTLSSINLSLVSTIDASVAVCFSLFSVSIRPSLLSFPTR